MRPSRTAWTAFGAALRETIGSRPRRASPSSARSVPSIDSSL
ncbi:MAG TPA: hypothetical protein VGR20_24385 [Acidimicrobiia bacterium]|nr:hypothetical protein [Acidimicrobiia bacterium]